MVPYKRTMWYGFTYFLQWHGSLIPRCLPVTIFSGVISICLLTHAEVFAGALQGRPQLFSASCESCSQCSR